MTNKKKQADREAAIRWLCQKDFEFINSGDGAGLELLDSILDSGFKGYGNYTDQRVDGCHSGKKTNGKDVRMSSSDYKWAAE
jgi:hypothetical protein